MYTKLYIVCTMEVCAAVIPGEAIAAAANKSFMRSDSPAFESSAASQLGFLHLSSSKSKFRSFQILKAQVSSQFLPPIKASTNEGRFGYDNCNGNIGVNLDDESSNRKSRNIVWHKCSVERIDREKLLQQKGCVVWITGLSGSGKSTLACAVSRALHSKGKLTYILDGDNVRHGLNRDLSFKAEDRLENIRRIGGIFFQHPFLLFITSDVQTSLICSSLGEVAKLFADAGVICIASVISPYQKERDACRALLPDRDFIEVFMDTPLQVCEARDPKGLYKLVRAGKIKGFTGIDDPYEPPLKPEITIHQNGQVCPSPCEMVEKVVSYLEMKGFLLA